MQNAINLLIGKTPFLRLLLPVTAAIITASLLPGILPASLPAALGGLLLTLSSLLLRPQGRYRFRWLFGAGVSLILYSLTLHQFRQHEESVEPVPPADGQYYLGTVLEIPEVKPRSIALNVKTAPPEARKVILYLEPDDAAKGLTPGDEIVFRSNVKPFGNSGNPDDFDYAGYMRIKGFAGSGYVPRDDWRKTGRQTETVLIIAQRFRAKALSFYRSFGLGDDAHAFVCALTLGYKAYLSNDLREAFSTSGTAHVLALSGLHVGIIYTFISLLFSFLGKHGGGFLAGRCLIIAVLWTFVFTAGMPASAVRAAIMLTLFSIGTLFRRHGSGYNSLAAAAFFILIFRPHSLFDAGFLMSFSAVFAILFFNPKLIRLYTPPNRAAKYLRDLLCITVSAQLGVFPLALYCFGTFPTWFFITNIPVVPLVGIIIYATLPLILTGLLCPLRCNFISALHASFQWVEKTLIEILLKIVRLAESMPFAQISDSKITLLQLILLLLFIYPLTGYLSSRRAPPLIVALTAMLLFQLTVTHNNLTRPEPQLTVFNTPGRSEIAIYHDNRRHSLDMTENSLLPHPEKRILFLSDATFISHYYGDGRQFPLDVLILSRQTSFDIERLSALFCPAVIVLDSSLPRRTAAGITRKCAALGIAVHDVTENGAFSLKF
ncbi:MAG: ComEC family competence protein [Proteiniphilum sp.]|jgi:competence protein ComEC|nr:ComEC family competence protein [Proteiniphilum sp.]